MTASGLSGARLGRLREVLAGYVQRGDVPGLVAALARRGEPHVETLGAMAFGGPPMRRDSIFRVASMTKPVAAVAAMILVEECRLRLDEPVDRLLPELAERQVLRRLDGPLDDTEPARRPILVRDLLTFTMGFGQVYAPPDAYPIVRVASELQIGMGPPSPATTPAPDEWLRRLSSLPLMAHPGERWMYNTGSDVLGVLIARAAEQRFDDFLRERIFEPLGMTDTGFSVPAEKLDRFVTGYWTNFETGLREVHDEPAGGQWSRPPAFPSGAGGLVSTVDDYLAFGQMLLNKGKHGDTRILSRPAVEAMTADQLTDEQRAASRDFLGDSRGWGLGVAVVTRRDGVASVPGRYGWDGGLGTSWANDPTEELTGVLLTQVAWTSPSPPAITRDFWTCAYQAIDD